MNQSLPTRIAKVLAWLSIAILVLLPFNEFLTTWIASNYGHLDFWRVYKELLITLMTPFVVYLIWKSKSLKKWITRSWLIRLIFLFAVLTLISGIWAYQTKQVNLFALSDGLVIDLRFLLFFIVTAVITNYTDLIKRYWQPILLWPAALAILFGFVQLFLPIDFLKHFGYGPNTIPAYSTVDQKVQYRRIQSTLRGADPLGAYLVLIIPAYFIGLRKRLTQRLVLIVLSLVVLFYTYSRSAYIGLGITLALFLFWSINNQKQKKSLLIVYIVAFIICAAGVVGLRYNQTAENIFFHTSGTSKAPTSSNAVRFSALRTGFDEVVEQPLGGGTGTAGPASVHNNHPARIAENYYIQIAQETGWLGMVLFISINILVAAKLWIRRKDSLSKVLLASLAGISFIGLVSHVWADDTLSLLWWGLAGIALSPAILKGQSKKRNEKNKKAVSQAKSS